MPKTYDNIKVHFLWSLSRYWLSVRELTQQTFCGLQYVLETPSKHVLKISVTIFRLPLKTSWRNFAKTSWRRVEDIPQDALNTSWKTKNCYRLKTSSRLLEDMSWRLYEDMSSRRLEDVLETSRMFTGDICI